VRAAGPEKPAVLSVTPQTIPEELRKIPNWVCWQLMFKVGATKPWTKVPMNARTGYPAKTNDPSTWVPFGEALKAALESPDRYDGIGFVFTVEAGYVGVDLDQCRDPETGEIEPWARDIINPLESYTEVTPSGTGVHIIVRGMIPAGRKKGQIELYATGRYFTFTGRHLEGMPLGIEERPEAILKVFSDLEEPQTKWAKVGGQNGARPAPTTSATPTAADEQLLEHAKRWRNGDKIADLWDGVWQVWFPSQSEADQSLCDTLAFLYDKDAARIDRMFRRSGLMREKWDESHRGDGATYGELTIAKAIAGTRETYKPRARETGVGGVARPTLPSASSLNYRWADQIEATDVQWIWDGVLAVGKLTIFAGDPKVGKTLAAEYIAAQISTGGKWPDGGTAPLGNVLLFEVEDAESDTTKPRLIAHGADLARVCVYGPEHGDVTDPDGSRRAFSLDRDLPALRTTIIDTRAKVVIISPVMTFMGQKDSMRDQEVRQVLTPLVAMAAELKVAVVAVIHLNKADDKKAMHRIQASMAFAAVARVVRVFAKDPDEKGRHLMLSIGGNNTADNEATPTYRIASWCWHCQKPVGKRCRTCEKPSVAKMEWGESVEGVNVERVMGRPTPQSEEERTAPAADALLYELVPDGNWVPAREVYEEGEKRGITGRSIKSARHRQRLGCDKKGFTGGWYWFRNHESAAAPEGGPRARARVDTVVPDPWDTQDTNKSTNSTKSPEGSPVSVETTLGATLRDSPTLRAKGRPPRLFVKGSDPEGENVLQSIEGSTASVSDGQHDPSTRAFVDDASAAPKPWSLIQ